GSMAGYSKGTVGKHPGIDDGRWHSGIRAEREAEIPEHQHVISIQGGPLGGIVIGILQLGNLLDEHPACVYIVNEWYWYIHTVLCSKGQLDQANILAEPQDQVCWSLCQYLVMSRDRFIIERNGVATAMGVLCLKLLAGQSRQQQQAGALHQRQQNQQKLFDTWQQKDRPRDIFVRLTPNGVFNIPSA